MTECQIHGEGDLSFLMENTAMNTHTFNNHTQRLVLPSFPLFGGERGFTLASLHTFCLCPLAFASVSRRFKALFTTQHRHRRVVYPATCHSMFYASYRSLQYACGYTSTLLGVLP